jgi:hypothetical protein
VAGEDGKGRLAVFAVCLRSPRSASQRRFEERLGAFRTRTCSSLRTRRGYRTRLSR